MEYRMGNLLSGRRPSAAASALSLMCIAKRGTTVPVVLTSAD